MGERQNQKNAYQAVNHRQNREREYLVMITRVYVLFVLALYPLYVTEEGYDNIIFRKAQVYWSVTILFLIVFALFYLVYIFGREKDTERQRFWKKLKFSDWALLIFLLAVTLSFLFSPYKSMAWLGMTNRNDGYLTMLLMILCYFPVSRYYRPVQLDFSLYAIGSSVVCAIGFLQFYGYDFLRLFPYNRPPYVNENGKPLYSGFSISFRSTIGNIDFLSCYVCIAIVVFGVLFIKSKGWRQYLYLAAAVMNFTLMIIGGADAGKVGTLGTMALLVPYWIYTKKSLGKVLVLSSAFGFAYCLHHWVIINKIMPGWTEENRPIHDIIYFRNNYSTLPLKPIFAVAFIAFVVGVGILLIRNTVWLKPKAAQIAGAAAIGLLIIGGIAGVEMLGKALPPHNIIYQAREIMHGNLEDEFGSKRGFIWKRAMEMVRYQPVFGTGPDTFIHAFGELNQNEAKNLYRVIYDKAHNDFIQILLCEGIPGLLTYLALIAGIIISSIKKSFGNLFALAALGGVLAYLIQSFFGVDTLTVTPIFWTLLAILRIDTVKENRQLPE